MTKLLSFLLLIASAGAGAEFRTERIALRYDAQFRASIRWLAGGSALADNAGIEIDGRVLTAFQVDLNSAACKNSAHPEFGPSLECTLAGRAGGIERRVRVLFPDKLPDVAVFEQSYRNLGSAPVRVGRVWSQRWTLEQPASELASFQGGAYAWGKDYAPIMLQPGFKQSNFQGLDDRTGPEGEGGGMPIIDVWSPKAGVALAHLETVPQWIWLPVEVRADGKTDIGIWEQPQARFKQKETLGPNEEFRTVMTAVIFHHGDYYDALHNYGELLRARGIAIPRTSPPSAYEPYWKTWAFNKDFTQTGIFAMLPELKRLGIKIANLDDGWFDWYGDWQVDRSAGKFPGGDADMKNFVRRLHEEGFKTNLWWYPIGVSPESRLAKEHKELLIEDERGNHPLDDRNVALLCPAYAPALANIEATLTRFVADYGYDGVYVDSTGLTAVPPCFNPAHRHASPLDSFQSLPKVYERINRTLRRLKQDPWFEVCICGIPHSPYNMPWYFIANASDPTSPAQARMRIKVEKAIRGPEFCVGECYQVPIQEWTGASVPESFETTFGTGAQLTTFFGKLTEKQQPVWERWFRLYRELGLSSAEYLNLYDVAFDKPEIHAVRKGGEVFYGIFAPAWPNRRQIELRGLNRDTMYALYDYGNDRPLGKISGARPFLKVAFKDALLVRATPVNQ